MDAVADGERRSVWRAFRLLAPAAWPEAIAGSVRSVTVRPTGTVIAIRLNDSLAARRLILELTGALRGPASEGLRDLAEILAERWEAATTRPDGHVHEAVRDEC